MSLITVVMSLVRAYGSNDTPAVGSGTVLFTPTTHGVYQGSMRSASPVEARITSGVMTPVELVPGPWEVVIRPREGRAWKKFVILLEEGMPEPVDLATLAPEVTFNGTFYAKGDPGPKGDTGDQGPQGLSAYAVAVNNGFQGTEYEWLESLRNTSNDISVSQTANGLLYIEGPSVSQMTNGVIVLFGTEEPDLPNIWAVNPLAAEQSRPITSLFYEESTNKIYSGYGDWTLNGDEIGVVTHNIFTNETVVEYFPAVGQNTYKPDFSRAGAYTEAIEVFRSIDGHMYIPHIDGAGFWEGSGYISNESGEWNEYQLPGQAIHVFDIQRNSQGLWACGSGLWSDQTTVGPQLWFRPDGGQWHIVYREPITAGRAQLERYYQIKIRDDRAYVQALGNKTYMSDWGLKGFKYVPSAEGETYPSELPTSGYDMIKSAGEGDSAWNIPKTRTITVGDYTYMGDLNGTVRREALA